MMKKKKEKKKKKKGKGRVCSGHSCCITSISVQSPSPLLLFLSLPRGLQWVHQSAVQCTFCRGAGSRRRKRYWHWRLRADWNEHRWSRFPGFWHASLSCVFFFFFCWNLTPLFLFNSVRKPIVALHMEINELDDINGNFRVVCIHLSRIRFNFRFFNKLLPKIPLLLIN